MVCGVRRVMFVCCVCLKEWQIGGDLCFSQFPAFSFARSLPSLDLSFVTNTFVFVSCLAFISLENFHCLQRQLKDSDVLLFTHGIKNTKECVLRK